MVRVIRLAVFLALGLPAATASAGLYNARTATLENGLRVVVVEAGRAPVVTHMLWYQAGAADDPPGRSGIAHYLEHLMFKGSANVGPYEMRRSVERSGGRDNAFTTHDVTSYWQTVPAERLADVMRMEADRMAAPTLDPALAVPELEVVIQERRQRTDSQPGGRLYEQASRALYPNHPYGLPVIGWEHEIRGLKPEDARAFHAAWYTPGNAILVVAGRTTLEEVLPIARRTYGAVPARPLPARKGLSDPPRAGAVRVEGTGEIGNAMRWSRIYPAPSWTADPKRALALVLLSEILGWDLGRFSRALTEDGADGSRPVASDVGAGYSPMQRGPTSFGLYGGPTPETSAEAFEAALTRALDGIRKEGVTEEELKGAKTRLTASVAYALDGSYGAANALGRALSAGVPLEEIERWPELLQAVTKDEVDAALRAVLVDRIAVTTVLRPGAPS